MLRFLVYTNKEAKLWPNYIHTYTIQCDVLIFSMLFRLLVCNK